MRIDIQRVVNFFVKLCKAYRIMCMNGNYDVDDADDWKEVLDDYNDVDPIKIRIENDSEAILKQYTVDISAPSSNGENSVPHIQDLLN